MKLKSLWPVGAPRLVRFFKFMRGLGRRIVCHEDTTNQSSAIASDPSVPSEDTVKSPENPPPPTQCAEEQKSAPLEVSSEEARWSADQSGAASDRRVCMNQVPRRSPLEVLRQVLRACGTCLRNRPQDEYFYRKRLEGFPRLASMSGQALPMVKVVPSCSSNSLENSFYS